MLSWFASVQKDVTSVFDGITSAGNEWKDDFSLDLVALERPPDRVVVPLVEDSYSENDRFGSPKKQCRGASSTASTTDSDQHPSSSSSCREDEGDNSEMVDDVMQDFSPDQVVSDFMTRKDPNTGRRQVDKKKFIPLSSCPQLSEHRILLSEARLEAIWRHLPVVYRYSSIWKLIYCPRVHGVSLRTFYRQCDVHQGPTLVFCEDAQGHVFGCYATETWKCHRTGLYYGDPSCFVFSFAPGTEKECFVYNWGGQNRYFQFSDSDCISMGGGDAFALWIGADFLRGSSAPSSTFLNSRLSSSEQFVLKSFECWSFDHPMGTRLSENRIDSIINDIQILDANAYSGEVYDVPEGLEYEEPGSPSPQMDERLRGLAAGLRGSCHEMYGG